MNNNRGNNNNRRRGRGNNNRQQGGQQTNRIDSRARGNAPQLLEKYRKLAHDAHLNGDRVTEEYYLQFADHYFRVLADQKQRQEEARQPRRDDRPDDYRSSGYGDEFDASDDPYDNYNQPSQQAAPTQERAPRPERDQRPDREPREPREQREPREPREPREQREVRDQREPRAEAEPASEAPADGERSVYEPAENPFLRDNRAPRSNGLKQRKPRRPRDEDAAPAEPNGNFDPNVLPPSISSKPAEDAPEAPSEEVAAEKPRARRRTRKAAPGDDAGNPLEAVNG